LLEIGLGNVKVVGNTDQELNFDSKLAVVEIVCRTDARSEQV
jgi:hypothetical protein